MKGYIIINPSSGTQTVQKMALRIITKLLSEQSSDGIFLSYTHGKDDARKYAAALKPGEYDFVMAVGGDGTVNEVVAGLYESQSNIPLVILPAGTTNDFAASLELPKTVDGVCDMIHKGITVPMDIGSFNGIPFFNVAAGGALSEVAHTVSSDMKTTFGRLAYLVEGGKKFLDKKFATTPLVFELDGQEEIHDVYFFIIANSTSVGGFHKISPLAKINDGLLELLIVKKLDALDVLPVLNQIQSGTHINDSKRFEYRQIREIKIRAAEEGVSFPLDYDGEAGGDLPLHVQVIPQAIRLVVPGNPGTPAEASGEKQNA